MTIKVNYQYQTDRGNIDNVKRETVSKVAKSILSEVGWLVEGAIVAFSRDSLGEKMRKMDKAYANWQINEALRYAKERGYLKVGKNRYVITEKGRKWIDYNKLKEINFSPTKTTWDKQWRIIVFDIPEAERDARDLLREKLFEWDCTKLQNSVFITPHACEKELDQITRALSVETYIHVIRSGDIGQSLSTKLTREYKL